MDNTQNVGKITNNIDSETQRLRNVLGLKHIIKHEDFILDVMNKLFFEIIYAHMIRRRNIKPYQ